MGSDTIYAWHCVRADGTTNRLKTPDVVGVRYEVEGEVVPCGNGLHASVNPLDALCYGGHNGRMKRVLLEGTVPHGTPVDKHAGKARTTHWELMPEQTEQVFRAFAFWCVETVARPAVVEALRKAGYPDHAATLEALPPATDKASAEAFRSAANDAADADYDAAYAANAARAAAYAAHAAADATYAANAANAADAAADAAAYNARKRMGEELTRRLLELAPVGYTEEKGE